MKVLQTLLGVAIGLAVLVGLAGQVGCSLFSRDRSHRETVYVDQSPYEEPPQYVIVREAPPPVIVEHRPPPPGQGHIWIEGYWHWDDHRYVWQPGHWALPPRGRAVWVAPRYEKHEQGFRYMPGRWQEEQRERPRDDEPRHDKRRDRRPLSCPRSWAYKYGIDTRVSLGKAAASSFPDRVPEVGPARAGGAALMPVARSRPGR